MTKAEAKRHACWLVAEWAQGRLDGGVVLSDGRGGIVAADGRDEARICAALDEVIAELRYKGYELGNPRIDGRRRSEED